MQDHAVILFDLGGVLVELELNRKLLHWLGDRVSPEEIDGMWLHSESVRAHEMGRMTPEAFARAIVEEFQLPVDAGTFLAEFPDFVKHLYPGAEALVEELSRTHRIAVLSNISEIHWEKTCRGNRLESLVHKVFLSCRVGIVKPDAGIFEHVIREMGVEPADILYFDDNPANVAAGRAAGIESVQVPKCANPIPWIQDRIISG